tara:strand:+ start:164 stop:403 length:240 start_codon:yes stop_codon:yes gene_type:complete
VVKVVITATKVGNVKDLTVKNVLFSDQLKMRTQNKENYYYWFWIVAMVAFIVPQVFTAWAYLRIVDVLESPIRVEVVNQ